MPHPPSVDDEISKALEILGCQIEVTHQQFADRLISGLVSTFEGHGIPFDVVVHAVARVAHDRGLEGAQHISHGGDFMTRERYGLQPPPPIKLN